MENGHQGIIIAGHQELAANLKLASVKFMTPTSTPQHRQIGRLREMVCTTNWSWRMQTQEQKGQQMAEKRRRRQQVTPPYPWQRRRGGVAGAEQRIPTKKPAQNKLTAPTWHGRRQKVRIFEEGTAPAKWAAQSPNRSANAAAQPINAGQIYLLFSHSSRRFHGKNFSIVYIIFSSNFPFIFRYPKHEEEDGRASWCANVGTWTNAGHHRWTNEGPTRDIDSGPARDAIGG
nr:uncharacterized protein LOC108134342 isoform X2 [Drosophila bipectinata]